MRSFVGTLIGTLAFAVGFAAPAHAGSGSPLTLGVGGGVGVLHEKQPGQLSQSTFVNQANVRLKLLYFLGLDYSVDLTRDPGLKEASEGLQLAAKMRATALIYAIPTRTVSLYLGVGVGGGSLEDLVSVTSERNSYHGGLGLEVHLSEHVTFDVSYYMVVPGVSSVGRHVEHLALESARAHASGEAGTDGVGVSAGGFDEPEVGDFIDPRNFELMVRLFLFL